MVLDGEPPRLEGAFSATVDETGAGTSSGVRNEAVGANPFPKRTSVADGASCKQQHTSLCKTLKIGT